MAVVDRVQSPDLDKELLSASLGLVWGAHEVAVLSPLALPDSEALIEQAGLNVGMDHGPKKVFDALAHLHLVDLMAVRLLYSVHRLPHPQLLLKRVSKGVHVYENQGALPRAYVVGQITEVESPAAALKAMVRPFDPTQMAFVQASAPRFSGRSAEVEITLYESNRVEMHADLRAQGFLVLADTWYPGWEATVNGESVELHRANSVFRGVFLDPGQNEVVMRYCPSWGWTLRLWGLAWAAMVGILLIAVWRGRTLSA
jgi:hypothetical protein